MITNTTKKFSRANNNNNTSNNNNYYYWFWNWGWHSCVTHQNSSWETANTTLLWLYLRSEDYVCCAALSQCSRLLSDSFTVSLSVVGPPSDQIRGLGLAYFQQSHFSNDQIIYSSFIKTTCPAEMYNHKDKSLMFKNHQRQLWSQFWVLFYPAALLPDYPLSPSDPVLCC